MRDGWSCAGRAPRRRGKDRHGHNQAQGPRRGGGSVPQRGRRRAHARRLCLAASSRRLEALSQQRFRPPGAERDAHLSRADAGALVLPRTERVASRRCAPSLARDRGPRGRSRAEQRSWCATSVASTERVGAAHPAHARARRAPRKQARLAPTVRRLYAERAGSTACTLRDGAGAKPGCVGKPSAPARSGTATSATARRIIIGGKKKPVRIHGLLDDASRYVVALEAMHQSARSTCSACSCAPCADRPARRPLPGQRLHLPRRHAAPSRARRMGITLLHAKPYDAAGARQDGALLAHACASAAWTSGRRHVAPRPQRAPLGLPRPALPPRAARAGSWAKRPATLVSTPRRRAPTPRRGQAPRRAHRARPAARAPATPRVSVDGDDFELDQGFLAGRIVTVARCLVDAAHARGSSTRASASPSPRRPHPATPRKRTAPRAPRAATRAPRIRLRPARAPCSQGRWRQATPRATRGVRHEASYLSHFGLRPRPSPRRSPMPTCGCLLQAGRRRDFATPSHERASVVLTGDPGVGKTCVLRALRHAPAPGRLPTHLLPQRHPRPPRLLPPALPRPRLSPRPRAAGRLLRRQRPRRRTSPASASTPSSSSTRPTSSTRTRSTICTSCSITSGTAARCSPSSSSACPSCATASQLRTQPLALLAHSTTASTSSPLAPTTPPSTSASASSAPAATASSSPPTPLAMLHEAAAGCLRDIDRLATAALREAARRKKKLVERDILARVIDAEQIAGAA